MRPNLALPFLRVRRGILTHQRRVIPSAAVIAFLVAKLRWCHSDSVGLKWRRSGMTRWEPASYDGGAHLAMLMRQRAVRCPRSRFARHTRAGHLLTAYAYRATMPL